MTFYVTKKKLSRVMRHARLFRLLYHELFHMDFPIVVMKGKLLRESLFVKIFVLFTIKILVLH